jgi:hypothetical protein
VDRLGLSMLIGTPGRKVGWFPCRSGLRIVVMRAVDTNSSRAASCLDLLQAGVEVGIDQPNSAAIEPPERCEPSTVNFEARCIVGIVWLEDCRHVLGMWLSGLSKQVSIPRRSTFWKR